MADIPHDIILIILSALPIKSLVRFKAVSRSWRSTISSDLDLIRTHLERSQLAPTLFIGSPRFFQLPHQCPCARGHDSRRLYLYSVVDERFRYEADLRCYQLPALCTKCTAVKCSCDGLLLLADFCKSYLLWNPTTGARTLLSRTDLFRGAVMHGICYDPATLAGFKLVVIFRSDSYSVYSFSSRSWSEKREFPFYADHFGRREGIFAGGALYWVARKKKHPSRMDIVCFDSRDEKEGFFYIPKPKGMDEFAIFDLVCLRGRLCVYVLHNGGDRMTIWMKEEGFPEAKGPVSWKKLMIVENLRKLGAVERLDQLFFAGNDDDDIVIPFQRGKRYVYSPEKREFRLFGGTRRYRWTPYQHSLLFPQECDST